jgi:sulfur-carrier protein
VDDVHDTDQLVKMLHTKYPSLKDLEYRIAVNKDIILQNTLLHDKAIVALLPPFSGG